VSAGPCHAAGSAVWRRSFPPDSAASEAGPMVARNRIAPTAFAGSLNRWCTPGPRKVVRSAVLRSDGGSRTEAVNRLMPELPRKTVVRPVRMGLQDAARLVVFTQSPQVHALQCQHMTE
jgi:hypothetical protein